MDTTTPLQLPSCSQNITYCMDLLGLGNASAPIEESNARTLDPKDASWIMTSALIIFTMQTGFGLLEAGSVSVKSETNIMIKNALDVVFGGMTYWAFGFGCSFGQEPGSNAFIGVGNYFVTASDENLGFTYALFLFQLSFATTSTTIVSGAMAERTKLLAYSCFSMLMTVIYSIPAHWLWAEKGFLYKLGALDIAGCGPVHIVGGTTGLIATILLGPRAGALEENRSSVQSPMKTILGMFMLWWGWLRFNSGSVFIVSSNSEWKKAVTAAVNTIVASMSGGIGSVIISLVRSKTTRSVPYDIGLIVNGVLASLVSITAICTLVQPWEAFIIGGIGMGICFCTGLVMQRLKIDDPVGVVPVHLVCGIWGLLAVGLFIPASNSTVEGEGGLFRTGRPYMLGVQALSVVVITLWTVVMATFFLKLVDLAIGLRLSKEDEEVGADFVEHGISSPYAISTTDLETDRDTDIEMFNTSSMEMIKDLLKSCEQNGFTIYITNPHTDVINLEIRMKDATPSLDSGYHTHM